MNRAILGRVLLALVVCTTLGAEMLAQKRPDFSGTWAEDEAQRKSPYVAAGNSGAKSLSGPPPELVITQTPEKLVIEERSRFGTRRLSYTIAGSKDVNRYGAVVETSTTKWDGQTLVTDGGFYQETSQGESSWKERIVRRLKPNGEMVVESTRTDEDGQVRTLVRVYRKK